MKNEKLLNAIGEIDDDLIAGAVRDTGKKKNLFKWGSLAAVLVLGISLGFFLSRITEDSAPGGELPLVAANSIIILDVNPSIALSIDAEEKILSAEGLNEDGRIVLSGMDLAGVDLTVAVNAVIGSMLQKGYLSDLQNAILVSVENKDAEKSAALQERISSLIGNAFHDGNLEGSVLSQTLNDTAALEQMARDYNISLGKAALIQEVTAQDAALTAESLAPLSITEIALISQSRNFTSDNLTQSGIPSDKAYISREAALEIAFGHAKVHADDAAWIEVEFDSDDGIMVYEVEFLAGTVKYECDIDARTGQVVKFETENKGTPGQDSNPSPNPSDAQQPADRYIGEEAAMEAALANAGLSADAVDYINCRLEYDDGRPEHYEVEFASGNVQYEYEIDLYSGAVLELKTENYGSHHTDDRWHDGSHHDSDGSSADIGADAAKEAALSHAGLTASQVTKLKAEYDYDDGAAVYEVEFKYQGYEYEYKINAATGAVLEYEIDD